MLPQTCLWHDSALWPPESSAPIWALLRYQETQPSFKTDTKWLLLNLGQLRPVTSSQVLPSPVTDQQRPPLAPHRLVLYKPHSLPLSPIPPRFSWVSSVFTANSFTCWPFSEHLQGPSILTGCRRRLWSRTRHEPQMPKPPTRGLRVHGFFKSSRT